jgi:hypothetical protein
MADRSAFDEVVMMEQVSIDSLSGFLHRSQIPAKAKIESSAIEKQKGDFCLPCFVHS